MDMKYTYEELWKAYQRLQAENTALKQEIQQLKGRNIGECKDCLLYTSPSPRD